MLRFSSLIFISILALSACTKPDRGQVEGGATQFSVKSVKGVGVESTIPGEQIWKVAPSVTFSFYACLMTQGSRKPLAGQPFAIRIPGQDKLIPVKPADSEGCIRWTEPALPFNHFAGESRWIEVERGIVGQGLYTGERVVRLALNPWAAGDGRDKDEPSVIFLRDGHDGYVPSKMSKPSEMHLALAGEQGAQAQLMVRKIDIHSTPQGEGQGFVQLLVETEMEPEVIVSRVNGKPVYEKIPDGEFDVSMQVMATEVGPQNKKVLVLGSEARDIGKVMNGKLKIEFRIFQVYRANQGNLELVLRLTPRNLAGRSTMKPFNGIFRLGAGTQIEDRSAWLANICNEKPDACEFSKVVASAANYEELHKLGYMQSNERYRFTVLKVRFFMIQPGETATQRTVSYTASTCITDRQTGTPLADTPMVIRYVNLGPDQKGVERESLVKSTDASGCLNWDGFVFHKYYQPEEYFERSVQIEKASGINHKVTFYVNPWDTNINFGFDSKEFLPDTVESIRSRRKIRSRFFLGDYAYHTVRFLYSIDPFMDLEVRKTVLMELVPQVLRYSAIKDARKMTESLRDGIYLMKVGIQKSYLDPRDNSSWLLRNNPKYQAEMVPIGGPGTPKLASKEFITTNMALVRVVDGMIIYPIELTMRDLRLMRTRANFVVQLETVDERLIQAYHVFKRHGIEKMDLQNKLDEFRKKLEDDPLARLESGADVGTPDALLDLERRRQRTAQRADRRKVVQEFEERVLMAIEDINRNLESLKRNFESGGQLGRYLNSSGQGSVVPFQLNRGELIQDNFELNENLLHDLKVALRINDFSEVSLPSRNEVDLNLFIEKDSGLEKRSFVGPVIFLSNTYKDSVRATDNLDEAKCLTRPRDALDLSRDALSRVHEQDDYSPEERLIQGRFDGEENNNWIRTAVALNGKRQNNAYEFNQYFGSLSHLCYQNVDDLIEREKNNRAHQEQMLRVASMKSNLMQSFPFPMTYVSLTNEPLTVLPNDCKDPRVENCLEHTSRGTLRSEAALALANAKLDWAKKMAPYKMGPWLHRIWPDRVTTQRATWGVSDAQKLFFERNLESRIGLCNMLANAAEQESGKSVVGLGPLMGTRGAVLGECLADGGLIHDIKLQVGKTGNYTFLGGLNLNVNVGENFSFSQSASWSARLDITDFVGMGSSLTKASSLGVMSSALKPVGMGYGVSSSSSEGTSVSESTYLVSQIARFSVDLLAYERCAVVRLSDQAVNSILEAWGGTVSRDDAKWNRILRRGYFVCEGNTRDSNPPRRVDEMYFYFTQHFTEGDMLDQNDLYNHPWLLGLRGARDFTMFVKKARTQEAVNLGEFVKHLVGMPTNRDMAWALQHMYKLYRNVLPTFPGFYTVLDTKEDIPGSLLQQLSRVGVDPMGEVIRPEVMRGTTTKRVAQ